MYFEPGETNIPVLRPAPGSAAGVSVWSLAGVARRRLTRRFYPSDLLTLGFSLLLIALALAFPNRITMWPGVLAVSGLVMACVVGAAMLHGRLSPPFGRLMHDWAFAPLVYVIYLELYWVVGPLHQGWIADDWLMWIDHSVFGVDPTVWLSRVATPWLTESAQIAYASFYALVIAVGVELYARRKYAEFNLYVFACAFGFLVSYAGYLLVPAVGPRFTLHDFALLDHDLPGVLLTPSLRSFVNAGGLVPSGASSQVAIALSNRDLFPSGHTMMTIIAVYWSWRFRLHLRWVLSPVGAILVFATVYLRYHYVIDVAAGAITAALCIASTRKFHAWLGARVETLDAAVPGRNAAAIPMPEGRPYTVRTDPDSADI